MIQTNRTYRTGLAVIAAGVLLAGCSTTRFNSSARNLSAPTQLPPVASSSVQSQSLPPLGGTNGTVTAAPSQLDNSGDPALVGQSTNADGSFVSLNDVGPTTTVNGRDLSGPITVTKLLGAWTVIAGADRCRLNLTQTTKTGTHRYRASTPGCLIPALSSVSTWQLAGTQVQLYDERGAIVGSLLQTGNRFIGTLAGGIAVSMAG